MSKAVGQSMPLSLGRRVTGDFLRASMSIPLVVFEKSVDVAALAEARQALQPRPSWCALFTKAYAKTAAATPALRRALLTFPWQRLFQYERPSADIVVEANIGGEDVLTTVRLSNPDSAPLLEIDRILREHKERPLERNRHFRRALALARLPAWMRRAIWWGILNVSGVHRARYFATFGVSSVANWGVESLCPIAPWTTLLHYGTVDERGKAILRVTCDHRVIDGGCAAKALLEMERILQTEMIAELRALRANAEQAALNESYAHWDAPAISMEQ